MRLALLVLFGMLLLSLPVVAQEGTLSPDDIPPPMEMLDEGGDDILNFLLMGSDTFNSNNNGRTDVLLVVSVNRTAETVSMLSIPRDFYAYIPDYRVYRINAAFGHGAQNGGSDAAGYQLLMDTIRYNLGLDIDFYARVDFNTFRTIIDDLGGVEVANDCTIEDWRLIEPDLDPTVEENWAMFTLPVGVQTMDGDLALWFARTRRTSSDFDRGRRHQVIMRALWSRIRQLNLFDQLTAVWPQVLETVDTNIPLDLMLELAPLALTIDTSRIASYTFHQGVEVRSYQSPEGSSVLAPNHDAMRALLMQVLQPPTENQLIQEGARIEIVNATGIPGMGRVAAERLAYSGFVPIIGEPAPRYQDYTALYDFTGQTKGSSLGMLTAILRLSLENVVMEPTAERQFDFRVVLGGQYFACTHNVIAPQPPTDEAGEGA